MLENGLLLSCSYDRTVKVWHYKSNELFDEITKPDELSCMDYLPADGTLLSGTNSGSVLSHKIEDYLKYDDMDDIAMIEMDDMDDYEQPEDDQYDPLDGMTLDQNLEKILREQQAFTQGKATFKR